MVNKYLIGLGCILIFLILHVPGFFRVHTHQSMYRELTDQLEVGNFEDAKMLGEKMLERCNEKNCETLEFALAHAEFWNHASMIGSSEGFGERLYQLSGEVHQVGDLGWIDDQQPEIQEGRTTSRDLFQQVSVSSDEELASIALHNMGVIDQLIGDNKEDEIDQVDEEVEEDQEDLGETDSDDNQQSTREELSDEDMEELEEYAELLEQQQEKFQNQYNNQGRNLPDSLEGLEALLGGGSDEGGKVGW